MAKTKNVLKYTAIYEEVPEGGYVVRIPALGCVTQGETFEEAKAMARDAIQAYLASLVKHGDPIPQEAPVEIISSISVQLSKRAA